MKTDTVGRYEYVIDAYLTDFRGKATLPMIGGFMLQCATKHAEERKFGYSYMTERNRAWVLSRMAIELFEYPKNDSTFIIRTWVADINRLFTERHFAFEDETGKPLGYARSLWASIDLDTRRPTNVLELQGMVDFMNKNEVCPIEGMGKIPLLSGDCEQVSQFTVKYSDVDINGHLNSMKYIEHFVDVFNLDIFRTKDITRFEINYVAEGRYDTKLDIVQRKENDSIYILEMKNGDANICTSRLTWK